MYKEYILTIIRFPLVYNNNPKCDFFILHPPGKQDHLTVDIHFQLGHLNGIHTKEVDLLEFKSTNDLPSWYPVFQIPYLVTAKVHCSAHIASIKLIYIDKSQDPDIFHPTYNHVPHDYLSTYLHSGHNNRNTNNYYWSHNKQESSRNSSIADLLIELLVFKV